MTHEGSLITGTLEYLRLPFTVNVEPGMNVLVVTDTAHDPRVWQVIMATISELGAEPTLAMFDPRPADYYDPPPAVCEAMKRSDINVLVATTGMMHAPANMTAMSDHDVPCICLDGGMTLEMFQSGAVTEDQKAMAIRQYNVARKIFGADAKECRVTSRYGTDLTYRVEGRIRIPKKPGDEFRPYAITDVTKSHIRRKRFLFPNGEFNVPPIEDSANGLLVIDLCMHNLGALHDPVELVIKKGKITEIRGGREAHILRRYLETYGDENAYLCPAEASVGINTKALVRGIQREDKNIIGSMHFGLGTNIDVGGTTMSNIHMDGVILEPSLYVDGELRIEDGKFLVPVEGSVD